MCREMLAGGLAREEVMTGIRSSYKLSKTANIAQEMPGPTTWAFEIASACDCLLPLASRPLGGGWREKESYHLVFRLNAVVRNLLRTYGLRKQQHQPVSHRFHRPGHHRQQAEESHRGALHVYRRQTPSQPSANMDSHKTTSTAAGDMRLFLYETWKRWSVCVEPEDSAWFAQCPRTLCLRCPEVAVRLSGSRKRELTTGP